MRSSGRLLLSRIGHQHQPYSPVVFHSDNFIRFYSSQNPSEERSGVWNVLKKCSSWIKDKVAVSVIVPEGKACVIERHGKYIKTLTSGIHSLGSRLDKVAYVYSLKEETISLPKHPAVTKDNVSISVDGSMGVKIVDPTLSPYALEKPMQTVITLTETIVRAQIGKLTLDQTFKKRDALNERILMKINDDLKDWGLECVRYEIRDITLPTSLKEAAKKLAITKHEERASILATEAENQAYNPYINDAEEKKMSIILEAEAIVRKARATAEIIAETAERIKTKEGLKAEEKKLVERYEDAWRRISASSTVIVLPEETSKKK